MDKFKEISAQQAKFMSLSFFATRFGIREGFLEWGLLKVEVDDTVYYSPVLRIDSFAGVFIDIQKDKIAFSKNAFGQTVTLLKASMREENDTYIFSSPEKEVSLKMEEMKKLYEGKFLTPDAL